LKQRLKAVRRFRRGPKVWREVLLGMSVIFVFLAIVGGVVWWVVHLGRSPQEEVAAGGPAPPEEVRPLEDSRLIGTWQRDVDATIAEMHKDAKLSNDEEMMFRTMFASRTTIKYTGNTVRIETDGAVDDQPYKIVSKSDNGVILNLWFKQTKKIEEVHIRFLDDNLYRSDIDIEIEGKPLRSTECYRRVP
jgi:hypothetical protein